MKVFALLAGIGCALTLGCAAPGGGSGSASFTAAQIKDACMTVETKEAMAGAPGKPAKSAEEAAQYASFLCGMVSGMCSKDSGSEPCQKDLKRYGLIK